MTVGKTFIKVVTDATAKRFVITLLILRADQTGDTQ